MSDAGKTTPDDAGAGGGEPDGNGGNAFQAITSQADFDRAISARLERENAKYADYDALKDKAGKFDAGELAKLDEIEREKLARQDAETKYAELLSKQARFEVASAKGVPVALLNGGTKEELEAQADALLQFAGAANGPRTPQPDPSQGQGGGNGGDSGSTGDWLRDSLNRR
ncbi:hypothetical protein [Antrihabitans cavernicola]|uniref:DUF4355 domain-containing protein n=1 Tax=Antrihabitans cavernicola TaxID=2495913 RepID=A0A5A7SC43_9NOCA|nr:hypothetical protein [Spelaeibacter cavernicola]KAA0021811.1 hypothetical protein FOY51_15520 [Spelaeibacter cavernicola]